MLYTVRDDMKSSPQATIEAVAALGYEYVELAGYADGKFYGMEPAAFKALLAKHGLKAVSSHQGTVNMDNADQMIADVKAAGIEYFVIPVPPMGSLPWWGNQSMGTKVGWHWLHLTTLGKKCAEAGISLLYHNHDFEFISNGKGNYQDYLLENTDPAYVNFQLDLFWITKAKRPVCLFWKISGRFKSFHVKDMDEEGMFVVGEGQVIYFHFNRKR